MEVNKIIGKGNLTEKKWVELTTLEYVLTWNYTDNYDSDLQRYKQLVDKKYKKTHEPF